MVVSWVEPKVVRSRWSSSAPEDLDELLGVLDESGDSIRYVHVAHESADEGTNLIAEARKQRGAKDVVTSLASRGYYVYVVKDGTTRFVHESSIRYLWEGIRSSRLAVSQDDVVYSLEPPRAGGEPRRLLVLFSAMNSPIYQSSLYRYFAKNYSKVGELVPGDTAVLRVADIGGVVGAFYLDTAFRPDNAARVQRLLRSVMEEHAILPSDVVLVGASKGATAAYYHGLSTGLRFVAVDPVLSDDHYVRRWSDSHFTEGGVFPRTKDEVFAELVENARAVEAVHGKGVVVTSPRSPQYTTTRLFSDRLSARLTVFESNDPRIKDHPDVAPTTLGVTTSLINSSLYGWPLPEGRVSI